MVRQANFFALLDGVGDDEDVPALIDRLAKVEGSVRLAAGETGKKEQQQKQMQNPQSSSVRSEFPTRYDGRGQGIQYQGHGSMRNGGNFHEHVGNNKSNGYQHNHAPNNGYQQDNSRLRRENGNGYQGKYRSNGSQGGYSHNDGYRYQDNYIRNGGYKGGDYGRDDGYEYRQFNGYGRGNGGPADYRKNKGEDSANVHSLVHEGEYSRDNGYQVEDRQVDGYGPGNGRPAYYRRNYDGDSTNDNRLRTGQGYVRGGRGHGRGSNQGRGYWIKSQAAKADEQLGSNEKEMVSEIKHEKVPGGHSNEENVNGSLSEHQSVKDGGHGVNKSSEVKVVNANEDVITSVGNFAASDSSNVTKEASKDFKLKQKKSLRFGNTRKRWEEMTEEEKKAERERRAVERAKEIEEDKKLMTLEQYEKIRLEKKNALSAGLKTEERQVTFDKDFELMQPIVKKKEDVTSIKVHSEKDQLVGKDIGKAEKVNKSNISDFFQASGGLKRGGQYTGRTVQARSPAAALVNVKIDDQSQFPVLGSS